MNKTAGRSSFYVQRWKEISNDRHILSYISGYQIPFIETPTQMVIPEEKIWALEEERLLDVKIEKLLRKGAIEECEDDERQFISSYFLVPKPDGSNRFILNLKELNKFIEPPHFKLEDIRSALGLVSPNDFSGSIDLEDAYFLISICVEHQKYLRFKFKGKTFQFLCLPFGLCTSPYTFTKVMKPVVNILRLKGMILVLYLDDFLFIEKYKNSCENNMKEAVKILEYFGLVINYEKVH